MKAIKLQNTTKVVTVVDDEDFDRLNQFKWFLHSNGYVVRFEKYLLLYLHNEVLNLPSNSGIDHKNRIKWDNTKANLRIVDRSTNTQNSVTFNHLGYKGVTVNLYSGKFRATIYRKKKAYYLGGFDTPEQAAREYDKKAIELYGPDALTNEKLGNYATPTSNV